MRYSIDLLGTYIYLILNYCVHQVKTKVGNEQNNSHCFVFQNQLSPISKGTYKDYLGKLDLQYGKLLVNTKIKPLSSNIPAELILNVFCRTLQSPV